MAWTHSVTATNFSALRSSPHPCNLPGTINSGDLLILHVACKGVSGFSIISGTLTGWTLKAGPTTNNNQAVWAKIATGSEGATVSFTTSEDIQGGAAHVIHVPAAEWSGNLSEVEVASNVPGVTSAPNPPQVTASWGSDDNLFLVLLGYSDDDGTVSAYPTNYVDGVNTVGGAGTNSSAAVATTFRDLTAASDDPGAFTLSEGEDTACTTVVVRPAAAAAGTILPQMMQHLN